jgi:hypothetical protein
VKEGQKYRKEVVHSTTVAQVPGQWAVVRLQRGSARYGEEKENTGSAPGTPISEHAEDPVPRGLSHGAWLQYQFSMCPCADDTCPAPAQPRPARISHGARAHAVGKGRPWRSSSGQSVCLILQVEAGSDSCEHIRKRPSLPALWEARQWRACTFGSYIRLIHLARQRQPRGV